MNRSIIIAGALAGALIGAAILIDGELDRRHEEQWYHDCLELAQRAPAYGYDTDRTQAQCFAKFVDRGGY